MKLLSNKNGLGQSHLIGDFTKFSRPTEGGQEQESKKEINNPLIKDLANLTPELVEQYQTLNPKIKSFLQKEFGLSEEESKEKNKIRLDYAYSPIFGWVAKPHSREDAKYILDEDARDYRYENYEYNAEDIAEMPQSEVEERTKVALILFLKQSGFEDKFLSSSENEIKKEFTHLITICWQNRDKDPKQIDLLYNQELTSVQQQLGEIKKYEEELNREITRWSNKKNRFAKQQLIIAQKNFYKFKEENNKKINFLQDRQKEINTLHRRQQALNYLFRRLNGLEYTMVFAHSLDHLPHFSHSEQTKPKLKKILDLLQNSLEEFGQEQLDKPAVDKATVEDSAANGINEILKASLSESKIKSLNKLTKRLILLLQRAKITQQQIKQNPIKSADLASIENKADEKPALVRELKIIFYLLKKFDKNISKN